MEAEDSRLTTFHNWPTEASVQPDVLARAGFFYTGHGDNVKCFYCDGGLRNWEPGDDPWQEHAKWFPRCEFLIQSRGQDYISNIQDAHFHLGETVVRTFTLSAQNKTSCSAMLSPVVQTVLQMGFEASLVESLVQTKYLLTGQHYTSVSNLVTDVLQAEEEDRQRGSQSRGNSHPEEMLRQLQEERTCKVCMDKLVSIVFIPCGHLVVCGDCAASLRQCPICRAVIRGSVRAFMS
uniref:RING-type E3 ubiquitin transferase n=1 Tax=Mastacembelus armatus TaxID=205130 RepID=A0A7N8XF89_9TELE